MNPEKLAQYTTIVREKKPLTVEQALDLLMAFEFLMVTVNEVMMLLRSGVATGRSLEATCMRSLHRVGWTKAPIMDTSTGEIRHIPDNEPLPPGMLELSNMPNSDCPDCKGKGHGDKPTKIGKKNRERWVYLPCHCTKPKLDTQEKQIALLEKERESLEGLTSVGDALKKAEAKPHASMSIPSEAVVGTPTIRVGPAQPEQ